MWNPGKHLFGSMWMVYLFIAALLVLSACQTAAPDEAIVPDTPTPAVIAKQLATIGATHTPDEAQQQATRRSIISTPTAAPPTLPPTMTPYIGMFIGESAIDEINRPVAVETPLFRSTPIPSGNDLLFCDILPDDAFGRQWQREPRTINSLGCPIQEGFGFIGRFQLFENGTIYLNPATLEVWALEPGSIVDAGSYWYVDQPPPITTEGIRAPEGLRVPQEAIGAAWAGVAEITQNLGFAIAEEQDARVNLQRFEGGALFLDVDTGLVFALLANGDAIGPIDRGAEAGDSLLP